MDMNDNVISKADLWADRIHAFQESGLSRKDWCQQNEIPQSTLNYWIRKIQLEAPETEPASDPVFAKLPSEQELQFNAGTGNRSVTILLPENIRIEIGADCPARLLTTLLQALKNYA
ncbi:MAG: IS66 family insertion sequence element accessory protein TnpA [Lachnospiraceae bacterium]